jgi:hypothetical protein
MDILETVLEDVDWIHLAQDRDKLRVLVNMVMNLEVLVSGGEFGDQLRELTDSEQRLRFTELENKMLLS